MTAEYSAPNRISEHLLEAQRGAGERREHRGWRQCESRKKGGRATNYCFPGMTKPLETPAHSSCEWVPGANRRVGLSIGSH